MTSRLVHQVLDWPAAQSEARFWRLTAAGSLALLAIAVLGRAAAKPLWHDELFTLYIANQASARAIWDALEAGVDLNPPLYHLLAHWSVSLLGPTSLALRLPAAAGFVAASLALWLLAIRYFESRIALLAMLLPSLTGAYMYAYEARPYGLVLGAAGAAWLAWSVRTHPRWRRTAPATCAAAVAAGIYAHYYGALVLLPLAAGELVRTVRNRRIDWTMWTAFAAAAVSAVPLLPLVRGARQFAATFWSRPSAADLVGSYSLLVAPLALVVLFAAVFITLAAAAGSWRQRGLPQGGSASSAWRLPAEQTAAALAFLLVPLAGYLLAVAATGAFHERYVLSTVLGFSLLACAWCAWAPLPRIQVTALAGVFVLAFAARQASGVLAWVSGPADPLAQHRGLLERATESGPIVVSHALVYLPLVHYSPEDTRRDLAYLMRPAEVVRRTGVDTGARALQRLTRVATLDVEQYESFLRSHREFYVYGPASWLVPQLLRDGAVVQLVAQSGEMSLYRVASRDPEDRTEN